MRSASRRNVRSTHQATARLRLRTTPASTRRSSAATASPRSRVITGVLATSRCGPAVASPRPGPARKLELQPVRRSCSPSHLCLPQCTDTRRAASGPSLLARHIQQGRLVRLHERLQRAGLVAVLRGQVDEDKAPRAVRLHLDRDPAQCDTRQGLAEVRRDPSPRPHKHHALPAGRMRRYDISSASTQAEAGCSRASRHVRATARFPPTTGPNGRADGAGQRRGMCASVD